MLFASDGVAPGGRPCPVPGAFFFVVGTLDPDFAYAFFPHLETRMHRIAPVHGDPFGYSRAKSNGQTRCEYLHTLQRGLLLKLFSRLELLFLFRRLGLLRHVSSQPPANRHASNVRKSEQCHLKLTSDLLLSTLAGIHRSCSSIALE